MSEYRNVTPPQLPPHFGKFAAIGVILLVVLIIISMFRPFTTIPAGHVGVSSLFGKVDQKELPEGFHFINPFKKVYRIDCRNKELTLQRVGVPSRDQLTTMVDITVKWRVDRSMAAASFSETGGAAELENVHLIPQVRSLVREAGKGVSKAEDFYQDDVQQTMQSRILEGLQVLIDKGILIDDVLMRQIDLPETVIQGVLAKKTQEQKAEQQKAELDRFKTEQAQLIASAEAERQAAEEEVVRRKAIAEARAFEITAEAEARARAIELEGKAIRSNPELIKLRQIERWDGILPRVNLGGGGSGGGGIIPMIDLGDVSGAAAPAAR